MARSTGSSDTVEEGLRRCLFDHLTDEIRPGVWCLGGGIWRPNDTSAEQIANSLQGDLVQRRGVLPTWDFDYWTARRAVDALRLGATCGAIEQATTSTGGTAVIVVGQHALRFGGEAVAFGYTDPRHESTFLLYHPTRMQSCRRGVLMWCWRNDGDAARALSRELSELAGLIEPVPVST